MATMYARGMQVALANTSEEDDLVGTPCHDRKECTKHWSLKGSDCWCKAKFGFTGFEDGDLCFERGELFIIKHKSEGLWWQGQREDGECGRFPKLYVIELTTEEHRMLKMEQEEEVRRRLREEEEELKKLEEQIQREQQRRAEERKKMKEREQKVRERQRLLYAKRPSVLLELSSRENKEPILQRQGGQESSRRPQKNGGVSRMFWKWKRRSFSFKSDEGKVTVKRSISEAEDIRMPGESLHNSSEDHKIRPRGYSFCEGLNNQRECEELRRYLEREALRERERKEKRSSFRRLWRGERCPPQANLDTIVRQEKCLSKHTSYDSAQTCKQRSYKRTSKGDW